LIVPAGLHPLLPADAFNRSSNQPSRPTAGVPLPT
jgi:hypothetical protein